MDSQEDDLVQQDDLTPATLEAGGAFQFTSDAAALKQALIDEKGAPELLQHREELVDGIEKRLAEQEQLLADWEGQPDKAFAASIIQYDLHRVRYLLRGYLRARLRKLEGHVMAILDDEEAAARMSAKEHTYAAQYLRLFAGQMNSSLLDHLPDNFAGLVQETSMSVGKDMVDGPNLDKYVFCRVLEDCGHVTLDDQGNSQEFNQGDRYVVQYKAIRHLLADNAVQLI